MILKNVRRYKPSKEKQTYGPVVDYYISEDGKDVYENEHLFTKRWKLLVDPDTNEICSAEEDITMLYPPGYNICEIDELPEDFTIEKHFLFIDGKVYPPRKIKIPFKHKLRNAIHQLLE